MKISRLALPLAVFVVLSLCSTAMQAQDKSGKSMTVTGCLSKGDSPNEFYLTADNGKKYEVRSDKISLADHVGHKVSLTGTTVAEKAEDKDEDEKNEAAENEAGNLRVTNLKMISETCK